ncbi:MAG: NAD-dependent deacylase [Flavobacteriales bacterium]|nr:NAD-dependent deacylase [Flavobacteriales bacterium]
MKDRDLVVIFSGAGISAESGASTFRDSGGLWEQYRIEDVATPEAWERDPGLVLDFYRQRYEQMTTARPNEAHLAVASLEEMFRVEVITQNIDDLHERAGSTHVLHLHGEIRKARSTRDPRLVVPLNGPYLKLGDQCPLGSQLRPHIVWFGEEVPMMQDAMRMVAQADRFIVIGTSLQVYPAAGLVDMVPRGTPIHVVDPGDVRIALPDVEYLRKKASSGMAELALRLLNAQGQRPTTMR